MFTMTTALKRFYIENTYLDHAVLKMLLSLFLLSCWFFFFTGEEFASTTIMFMTDGSDTVSGKQTVRKELQSWATKLRALNHPVTVHTVGFTQSQSLFLPQSLLFDTISIWQVQRKPLVTKFPNSSRESSAGWSACSAFCQVWGMWENTCDPLSACWPILATNCGTIPVVIANRGSMSDCLQINACRVMSVCRVFQN